MSARAASTRATASSMVRCVAPPFGGERHQRRRVAQRRAVVGAAEQSSLGCGEMASSAALIDALGAGLGRRACRAPRRSAPWRSASPSRRAWCRRCSAGRRSAPRRCAPAHRARRRDRGRRSCRRSGELATKLRSRSSASLNASSGTAKWRSRARVRKSVT